MNINITERINGNLAALYNSDDPIYRALISDDQGTNPDDITLPTDIDLGVIASQIEWLRRLSIDLAKQLFIDQSSGEFLKYTLNEFFNSLRLEDESDVQWIQRTSAIVFNQKVSNASIIYALRPYSSQEPQILNVSTESAFADFCFADIYESGTYTMPDGTFVTWVPAISESDSSSYFTVKIILYDTLSSDLWTVTNIINRMIAAGISYILQINYM